MEHINEQLPETPKDPVTHPDVPDSPNPTEPEPVREPAEQPNPYPVEDPETPVDPGIEPVRDPEPGPPFPEPLPGGVPNTNF